LFEYREGIWRDPFHNDALGGSVLGIDPGKYTINEPGYFCGSAGYWDYATQSDTDPTAVTADSTGIGSAGNTGNFANYNNGADWNSQDGNVTTVGSNGGASAYGAFDMNGNVYEWNDLTGAAGLTRGRRGGDWDNSALTMSSSSSGTPNPSSENNNRGGFRLASTDATPIPEPGTWAAMAIFAGGAAYAGWRRRKSAKVA
jgi:formylglycine-generating enzyme